FGAPVYASVAAMTQKTRSVLEDPPVLKMTNRVPLRDSHTAPGHLTGEAKRMVRIIRELTRRDNGVFTREQFNNYCVMGNFTVDHLALFNHLLSENMVRLVDNQKTEYFEVVDQVEWISSNATQINVNGEIMSLRKALQGVYTIHEVINIAAQTLDVLWGNSRVYLYDPQSGTATLAISSGDRDNADSHYQGGWIPLRKLNAEAERRFISNGRTLSVVDLKEEASLHKADRGEEAITDLVSIEADYQNYSLPDGNPGKMVYGVFSYTPDQVEQRFADDLEMKRKHSIWALWTASNRIPNDERGRDLAARYPALMTAEPLSANNRPQDVAAKLYNMVLREVAQRISEICGGRGIREVWGAEERSIAKEEDTGRRQIVAHPAGLSVVSLVVNGNQNLAFNLVPQLTTEEKMELLKRGQLFEINGMRVRLYEYPRDKFKEDEIPSITNWIRDAIIAVYDGTELARGKSKEQMIRELSLEDRLMYERVIASRYTFLIEGPQGEEHNIQGVVSFNILQLNDGKQSYEVLKIPEAMIQPAARGRRLQVALTRLIASRVLRKYRMDSGFGKGFWLALTRGIILYATTQSLRVMKDFSRSSRFSMKRVLNGKTLTEEEKAIINVGSSGKADEYGIERNAYGGMIRIDEQERGVGVFGRKMDEKLRHWLDEKVGSNGRIHLLGYFTIWASIRSWFSVVMRRFSGEKKD
ncbi:MAG: hypothetical protein KKD13_03990, partial [Candidatus Margulisbacteria bacterium]|nr:hypothetical protein [Candidatus Margulisiibacteriota bacterium]